MSVFPQDYHNDSVPCPRLASVLRHEAVSGVRLLKNSDQRNWVFAKKLVKRSP
jgi:hypothetical protein